MPRFKVFVTRDASVTYSATVEADSLDEIKERMHRHGFAGPTETPWEQEDTQVFDNVEAYRVEAASGEEVYNDQV